MAIHQALVFIHLHAWGFVRVGGAVDLFASLNLYAVVVEYCGDRELLFDVFDVHC
jgi:hypothetical protein